MDNSWKQFTRRVKKPKYAYSVAKKKAQPVVVVKPKARRKKQALTTGRNLTFSRMTPFLPIRKWGYNMPYHEVFVLSGPATPETVTTLGWTLNGAWDPEVPAGGHQVMGFDTAMQYYEHYTVTKCSWTIQVYANNNSPELNVSAIAAGYYISPDNVPITGADAIVENGLMRRKIMTPNVANSRDMITLTGSLDMAAYFGKKIINEDDYRGDVSSNPAEQVYIYFFCHPLTVAQSVPVTFDVTMKYTALFTEPRKLALN